MMKDQTRKLLELAFRSDIEREKEIRKLRGNSKIHCISAFVLMPFLVVLIGLGVNGPTPALLVFVIVINLWISSRHDWKIDLLLLTAFLGSQTTILLAEQAGTEQAATRPESKSEFSDKPQPEAEGCSR
jgi:hypothetical protein